MYKTTWGIVVHLGPRLCNPLKDSQMKVQKSFKKFLKGQRKFWAGPVGRFLIDLLINVLANLIAGYIVSMVK